MGIFVEKTSNFINFPEFQSFTSNSFRIRSCSDPDKEWIFFLFVSDQTVSGYTTLPWVMTKLSTSRDYVYLAFNNEYLHTDPRPSISFDYVYNEGNLQYRFIFKKDLIPAQAASKLVEFGIVCSFAGLCLRIKFNFVFPLSVLICVFWFQLGIETTEWWKF